MSTSTVNDPVHEARTVVRPSLTQIIARLERLVRELDDEVDRPLIPLDGASGDGTEHEDKGGRGGGAPPGPAGVG